MVCPIKKPESECPCEGFSKEGLCDYPNISQRLPYQASIIGTRNIPPSHYSWLFLEDLARDLKGGQALRVILPLELGMPFVDKAWRRVCKKLEVRPHARAIKNGTNKVVFLWFDGNKNGK